MRIASPAKAIEVFLSCFDSRIEHVIDIGVQTQTKFLMDGFPEAHHYLFEPVVVYHPMIENIYNKRSIAFTLVKAAVSDCAGLMYQHLLSSDMSGSVTHSQLLEQADPGQFGSRLLTVQETPVIRLDEWANDVSLEGNYVVKIDVDGIESRIIAGAQNVLSKASLVIVEATMASLSKRCQSLESLGLQLFDIVGNGYYFEQLQQVDLIFVKNTVIQRNLDFQPWKKTDRVIWEQWEQIT